MQSRVNDAWAYFQAKSIKEHLAEQGGDLLAALAADGASQAVMAPRIARLQAQAARFAREKAALQHRAEALEAVREHLDATHERFAITEAILSLALAVFGLAALTQRRTVLAVAAALAIFGFGAGLWAYAATTGNAHGTDLNEGIPGRNPGIPSDGAAPAAAPA
jgi:hypothetical protein